MIVKYIKSSRTLIENKLFFYMPLVIGAVFVLALILRYAVNTPGWDQWEMVTLFKKVDNHSLSFADLWDQHNEHRIFFPLSILLAMAYITRWHTGIELFLNLFFAVGTSLLLFALLKQSIKQAQIRLGAAGLIAAWFFSPVQWENWLWGWQLGWFLCVMTSVLVIYLLLKFIDSKKSHKNNWLIVLAGLSAFVATFSLASGLFVWLLGAIMLALTKQNKKIIVVWVAAAALTTALYFYNFVSVPSPQGSQLHVVVENPLLFIQFILAYIAGPIGSIKGNLQAPVLVGGLFVVTLIPLLYLVWQRRRNVRPYLPWLILIMFVLISAVSTAFGRLGYGIAMALSSRYSTFSLLYVIGLTGLGFTLLSQTKGLNTRIINLSVATTIIISLPFLASSYSLAINGIRGHKALMYQIKSCTLQTNPSDGCLFTTYPSAEVVRPRLEYLKAKHWGGY